MIFIKKVIRFIGIILIIISLIYFIYYLLFILINNLNKDIELNTFFKQYDNLGNNITIDNSSSYLLVLEIPVINLKAGIYNIDDDRNNIDLNVSILSSSILPNQNNSILLLAAHSGNSWNSYFKNLNKLKMNDIINIYFEDTLFKYEVDNIYIQNKKTNFYLKKYAQKMLILITCLDNFQYLIIEAKNI